MTFVKFLMLLPWNGLQNLSNFKCFTRKWVVKFVKFWLFLLEMGCEIVFTWKWVVKFLMFLPGNWLWNFECFYQKWVVKFWRSSPRSGLWNMPNFECFYLEGGSWIFFFKFWMLLPGNGLWNLSNFECFTWKWVVKFVKFWRFYLEVGCEILNGFTWKLVVTFWMFLPGSGLWNSECFTWMWVVKLFLSGSEL